MESTVPQAQGPTVRLIVEIEGPDDSPHGRIGDGLGRYDEFHGWSSLAAAITRWRIRSPAGADQV